MMVVTKITQRIVLSENDYSVTVVGLNNSK